MRDRMGSLCSLTMLSFPAWRLKTSASLWLSKLNTSLALHIVSSTPLDGPPLDLRCRICSCPSSGVTNSICCCTWTITPRLLDSCNALTMYGSQLNASASNSVSKPE
ncbi:hypothetical protein HanIR_Chr04g0184321 [Helianthus annuus]|nr:hypothetical protein HanIR_Chr04g0184321 [Helianthus annuus]